MTVNLVCKTKSVFMFALEQLLNEMIKVVNLRIAIQGALSVKQRWIRKLAGCGLQFKIGINSSTVYL
jgi:hypothetical protein